MKEWGGGLFQGWGWRSVGIRGRWVFFRHLVYVGACGDVEGVCVCVRAEGGRLWGRKVCGACGGMKGVCVSAEGGTLWGRKVLRVCIRAEGG